MQRRDYIRGVILSSSISLKFNTHVRALDILPPISAKKKNKPTNQPRIDTYRTRGAYISHVNHKEFAIQVALITMKPPTSTKIIK